jgi:hypothetical protein
VNHALDYKRPERPLPAKLDPDEQELLTLAALADLLEERAVV